MKVLIDPRLLSRMFDIGLASDGRLGIPTRLTPTLN